MNNLTCYVKKMSIWWFAAFFTSIVIGLFNVLILLQSYFTYGGLSSELLIIGLIITTITYSIIACVIGIVLMKIRTEDEGLALASSVFNDAHEGIIIANSNNIIVDVNPTFCDITEYSRDEVIGKNTDFLIPNTSKSKFYNNIWRSISKQGHWKGEISSRKKSGQLFVGRLTVSAILNEDHQHLHYICLVSDITQSKEQQKKLELMAHYDELTKLPNRGYFIDRFDLALKQSKQNLSLLAVCFLDLDNFKLINDKFGHVIGDKLLVEVAQRIKENIREEDTVSRIGGDEFTLLLGDIKSVKEYEILLDRLHHTLAEPYLIEGHTLKISASCGVTIYPIDESDLDTLLRHADQAMYKAKLEGRNCYQLFNTEDDQLTIQRHNQLQEIHTAIVTNQFHLYYQPKINIKTGQVYGAEALLRWQHPTKGLLLPHAFLPVISGDDLEIKLGGWVIEKAIEQLYNWQKIGLMIEVSINISSYHLTSPTFFEQMTSALEKHPTVDSYYLTIEVLESGVLSDISTISSIITTCQNTLGINIALDDFGTGYSSLTHLRHLTVNTIKIDTSFVRGLLDSPSDYAIVEGIIGLADTFHRQVIAEGVETVKHGLMLLIMGCEYAQGYFIAKPMRAEKFPEWKFNYKANEEWLAYSQADRTPAQNHLKLFELSANHWLDMFRSNILSSPEEVNHWPEMDHKDCHCGLWLKRAHKEGLFQPKLLTMMEKAHHDLHDVARKLKNHYLSGGIDLAREGLRLNQLNHDFETLYELHEAPKKNKA